MRVPCPVPLVHNPCSLGAIETLSRAEDLADAAVWALIEEAELTPKPALVDGRGSGAHRDLSLAAMRRSARALRPTFLAMARAAEGRPASRALREELAAIGRAGEPAMLAATGGSNAHRGAIWALGLLLAATAQGHVTDADEIGARAAAIAAYPDRFVPASPSNGKSVAARYGVAGARGEAKAGFPHAVRIALPALRRSRARGIRETNARLDALMAVMAVLDDTCILHRGGLPALKVALAGARAVLDAGGTCTSAGWSALERLHKSLMALNASPGGAADMLAAALFLDRVTGATAAGSRPLMETDPWRS